MADELVTVIDINGVAAVEQDVELLTMGAGVHCFARNARSAVAENAAAMAAIRSELAHHGIDPKDVRTGQLRLQPAERYEDPARRIKIHGFEVAHDLMIVFRDVDKTGAVMDTLVDAGATHINGPHYSRQARPEAVEVARREAIRDALTRAEFFAETLGMKVRRVISMRDGNGHASFSPMASVSRRSTEVSVGTDTVHFAIHAQFELTRPT